jgi:hypothetical protein
MKTNKPLLILALIGIVLYISLAFAYGDDPQPAEDGAMLSKSEAAAQAVQFVESMSELREPRTFVTYRTHKMFSGYLQQQDLYREYLDRYENKYPTEYFTVEVADAATRAHYEVDVGMRDGRVLGWSNLNAPEGGPADATLEHEAALFLYKQGYDAGRLRLVPQPGDPPGRFVFESESEAIGDARLRLAVDVAHGEIAGFHAAFSVPETFAGWLDEQDATAGLLTLISLAATAFMALYSLFYAVRLRKEIPLNRGALLTLVFLLIYGANNFNTYPALKAVYGAEMTGPTAALFIVFLNFATLLMAVSLYLNLIAGRSMWEKLGRHPWPHWTEARFGDEVLGGMGRGYLLALFLLGVQQLLFFIAATVFHVWAVNDAADSLYNMFVPALFPLMAWAAGISEEAAYRLFGIAFFKKLFHFNFPAVLVPSVIWALSHTQYPIYPVYTRLVEVTALGLAFGYVFLRYGFFTALFAHTAMDSILMGMSLLYTGSPPEMAAGVFYMALPALVGWLISLLHSRLRLKRAAAIRP